MQHTVWYSLYTELPPFKLCRCHAWTHTGNFSSLPSGVRLVFATKTNANHVNAVYMLMTILHQCIIQSACCRSSPVPPYRQELVQRFVAGYMQKVKDCYLAGTGSGTLVISCSSSEILSNATTALEQVTLLILVFAGTLLLILGKYSMAKL